MDPPEEIELINISAPKDQVNIKVVNICIVYFSKASYDVRLVNPYFTQYKQSVGRLEVLYNDVWGTVCDEGFTDDVARVACASLGYG